MMVPPVPREFLQGLVQGDAAEENEQHGASGLQILTQLLHELIVDADVRQRAGNGAGPGAYSRAEQGIHEKQTYEQAPEAAGNGPGAGEVVELKQF